MEKRIIVSDLSEVEDDRMQRLLVTLSEGTHQQQSIQFDLTPEEMAKTCQLLFDSLSDADKVRVLKQIGLLDKGEGGDGV